MAAASALFQEGGWANRSAATGRADMRIAATTYRRSASGRVFQLITLRRPLLSAAQDRQLELQVLITPDDVIAPDDVQPPGRVTPHHVVAPGHIARPRDGVAPHHIDAPRIFVPGEHASGDRLAPPERPA